MTNGSQQQSPHRRASIYDAPRVAAPRSWLEERPHLPYLLPLLAFGLIMAPAGLGKVGGVDFKALWHDFHPWIYFAKTVIAAVLLAAFWRYYTKIRWSHLPLGVVVGIIGVPLWVYVEFGAQAIGISAPPPAADLYLPDAEIADPVWRVLFLVIRVAGPVLVVPLMEELFYRDFLMRALVGGTHYEDVSPGTFSWLSLLGAAGLFTLTHIQRPSALLWGLMIGLLMVRTKSLGACIVAHGVTNLLLYLWVIYEGGRMWQFM